MWTKLTGTKLWDEAVAGYASPLGRDYHNMGHVRRLYEIAEEIEMPYDRALDLAILAHDVIYDDLPAKESRSADWLLERAPSSDYRDYVYAAELIMTTADHSLGQDNRLVLLDLYDLGDLDLSSKNRELLGSEFQNLNGVGREQFLKGNSAFMTHLADRIEHDLGRSSDEAEKAGFERIVSGIRALVAPDPEQPAP